VIEWAAQCLPPEHLAVGLASGKPTPPAEPRALAAWRVAQNGSSVCQP
jgi:hypothetical protein